MNLNARKNEIEARLAEIRGLVDKETDTEKLSAYEKECDNLQNERSQIVAKLNIADKTIVKPIVVEKNSEYGELFCDILTMDKRFRERMIGYMKALQDLQRSEKSDT